MPDQMPDAGKKVRSYADVCREAARNYEAMADSLVPARDENLVGLQRGYIAALYRESAYLNRLAHIIDSIAEMRGNDLWTLADIDDLIDPLQDAE